MFKVTLLLTAVAFVAYCEAGVQYIQRPADSSRIINGAEATAGEFPHQVSLRLLYSGRYYHICGGSVIADGWVLTAAHCVDGQRVSDLTVAVDLHDLTNPGNQKVFEIDNIIMHERYNKGPGGFPNDIALLKLTGNGNDITKNKIALASGSNDFSGHSCIISGWGTTEKGSASELMKAPVRVLSKSECTATGYWDTTSVLDQHVCVKGYDTIQGTGACNGDSGGPLVCDNKLVGVTSWGMNGCHVGGTVTHPSVYVRVSYFYDWINSACSGCATEN